MRTGIVGEEEKKNESVEHPHRTLLSTVHFICFNQLIIDDNDGALVFLFKQLTCTKRDCIVMLPETEGLVDMFERSTCPER